MKNKDQISHIITMSSIDFAAAARKGKAKKNKTKTSKVGVSSEAPETPEAPEVSELVEGPSVRSSVRSSVSSSASPSAGPVPESTPGLSGSSADIGDFDLGRMKQSLLFGFADTASKFLSLTAQTWPKDEVLQRWHETLDATAAGSDEKSREIFYTTLIQTFHESFKRHYAHIQRRDESILSDESNAWLKMLRVNKKYRASAPILRAQLWQFVEQLASMSNLWALYSRCPPKLFERIKRVLGGFAARVQSGKASVRDIDPMTIAQELIATMGKDELRTFAESIMKEGGTEGISALISSLAPLFSKSGFDTAGLARKLQEALGAMKTR